MPSLRMGFPLANSRHCTIFFAYWIADCARFDLAREIADSEHQKPWSSNIHAWPANQPLPAMQDREYGTSAFDTVRVWGELQDQA